MLTPPNTIPRGPFGRTSTAEDVTAGIDLAGKCALVTGATSGIGLETVRVLASRGAHVLAVGRTREKVERATAGMRGKITPFGCDQADFAAVAACADAVNALGLPLHIVIANAGIIGQSRPEYVNGVEKTFAVNHLSHFILVNRLLPSIRAGGNARIVAISSRAHHRAPSEGVDFASLHGAKVYRMMTFYGQSKLANHLFARELARRLDQTGITANAVHPGLVDTNIFHNLPPILHRLVMFFGRPFMKTVEQGAATMCYVATAPALAGVRGVYFADCNPHAIGPNMENDTLAAKLWAVSEDLTRPYLAL